MQSLCQQRSKQTVKANHKAKHMLYSILLSYDIYVNDISDTVTGMYVLKYYLFDRSKLFDKEDYR